ncbi:MAG: hypothetical protein HRU15_12345, partial [Planctomycetes bacterium]|nr:hypothetical protein [Planctomycetota bacterium]
MYKGFALILKQLTAVSMLFVFLLLGQTLAATELLDIHFVKFVGRLHVVILHMPIGILFVAAIFEFLTVCRLRLIDHRAQIFLWLVGSAAALVTVFCGIILSKEESILSDEAFWHMWISIGAFACSLLVIVFYRGLGSETVLKKGRQVAYRCSVLVCVGLLFLAGHKGGVVTKGPHYISKYAPWTAAREKKPIVASVASVDSSATKTEIADKTTLTTAQDGLSA